MSFSVRPGPYIPASRLEDPPLVPHAYDDEFDGTVLDPSWVPTAGFTFDTVSAIDPYSGFATGGRYSLNSWRKSWLMMQPGSIASTAVLFTKLITFPSECFVWVRASFTLRHATQINDEGVFLVISDTDVGTNSLYNTLNECDTNIARSWCYKFTNNAWAAIGEGHNIGGANNAKAQAFCFLGIQKLGTTYHFWAATENGNWQWMGSTVHASTFNRVIIGVGNRSQTSPGNLMGGFDFFRFRIGRYLP